uniref:Retrovirus-related Pol polyprotein from transposon TNT 1-94 n=1 Tax=Tanacetum cinerariifolium TaxID=118510 RepID=A0A6L2L720_TANCI|nr:retrovirus-related Pol polyprotein from transposon TNT 1-94 [Tanacetum cinerariifolium]
MIEETRDLISLSLDELIRNRKGHEMISKKDSKIVKTKRERIFLALKAKKESSDEECSTSSSKDEEYVMAVRDFKKCGDPNHLIGECPKPAKDKNQRAFVGGSWSYSDEEDDEKVKDKTCLVAQASSKLASKELVKNLPKLKFDKHFCDACKIGKQAHASHKAKNIVSTTRYLELLHMDLFVPFTVRSYGGNRYTLVIVDDYSRKPTLDYFRVFGSKCFLSNTKDYLTKFDPKSYEGVFIGYSQNSKAYIILNKHTRKVKELLNMKFDETPLPSKTSPLVDDGLDEEEAIKVSEKKNLENDIEDENLEIDEIVNIKESRNHPL